MEFAAAAPGANSKLAWSQLRCAERLNLQPPKTYSEEGNP